MLIFFLNDVFPVLPFMLMGFMILIIYFYRDTSGLAKTLLVYYILCISLALINTYYPFLPVPTDSSDRFIPEGFAFANALSKDFIGTIFDVNSFQGRVILYQIPLGFIFFLTGNSLLAGSLFSIVFGTLSLYEFYLLTKSLYGDRIGIVSVILLALSPYYILLSQYILRDTMVLYFILLFFRLCRDYELSSSKKTLYLFILSFVILLSLRPLIGFGVFVSLIIFKISFIRSLLFRFISFIAIISFFVMTMIFSVQLIQDVRILKGLQYLQIETLSSRSSWSSEGDSNYTEGMEIKSYQDAIKYGPLLSVYFMGSPFPWQVKKLKQGIALLDSIPLWIIYIFALLEFKNFYKSNPKWGRIILIYLAIGIFGSSLIQANIGSAQRHRVMFTVFLIPLFAQRIVHFVNKRKSRFSFRYQQNGNMNKPASLPLQPSYYN
jgi:4-amino-4-deoxy-L-arabinose transferase-like glycosyltransferase